MRTGRSPPEHYFCAVLQVWNAKLPGPPAGRRALLYREGNVTLISSVPVPAPPQLAGGGRPQRTEDGSTAAAGSRWEKYDLFHEALKAAAAAEPVYP